MIIYKITNDINDKVYIGQTIHTLAHRKSRHLQCVTKNVDSHLYNAMRKYGIEHFKFETIATTNSIEELNYLESYYIIKYDSVRNGYNMGYGGDNNVMFSNDTKEKHDTKMRSDEVRAKISKSMKEYKKQHKVSQETRTKLSNALKGNHNFGSGDTRSIGCYCIDKNGKRYDFHSYKDGGIWWYNTYAPFPYSECIYQRKIIQSINYGYSEYGRKPNKIIVEYPKWFKSE